MLLAIAQIIAALAALAHGASALVSAWTGLKRHRGRRSNNSNPQIKNLQ